MFENYISGQVNTPMCQVWLSGARVGGAVERGNWSSSPGGGWPKGLTSMETAPHQSPSTWQAGPVMKHLEAELGTAGGQDYCRESG